MIKLSFFKRTFFILLFLFIFSISSFSSSLSDYLDKIIFSDLQLQAVTVDMYLYLGWLPEAKEEVRKASQKAINDLEEITSFMKKLTLPQELISLKTQFLKTIAKLKEIYKDIDKKKEEEIEKEFTVFNNLHTAFLENLKKSLKYRESVELPKNFKSIDQETKLTKTKEDKSFYKEKTI
jgi:hypothetical protein